MKERILLLGPPASGKGTQADLIEKQFRLSHVSMGALLRSEIAKRTALGLKIHQEMNQGKLLSDDLVISIMASWMKDHESRFVFDGFPRTVGQAKALDQELEKRGESLDLILLLELSLEEAKKRMADRLSCPHCEVSFSRHRDSLNAGNSCPRCHKALLGRRDDDKEEVLQERFHLYQKTMKPIKEYYQRRIPKRFYSIDARKESNEVFSEISALLTSS